MDSSKPNLETIIKPKKLPRKLIHDFVDLAHDADELPRIKAILAEY